MPEAYVPVPRVHTPVRGSPRRWRWRRAPVTRAIEPGAAVGGQEGPRPRLPHLQRGSPPGAGVGMRRPVARVGSNAGRAPAPSAPLAGVALALP